MSNETNDFGKARIEFNVAEGHYQFVYKDIIVVNNVDQASVLSTNYSEMVIQLNAAVEADAEIERRDKSIQSLWEKIAKMSEERELTHTLLNSNHSMANERWDKLKEQQKQINELEDQISKFIAEPPQKRKLRTEIMKLKNEIVSQNSKIFELQDKLSRQYTHIKGQEGKIRNLERQLHNERLWSKPEQLAQKLRPDESLIIQVCGAETGWTESMLLSEAIKPTVCKISRSIAKDVCREMLHTLCQAGVIRGIATEICWNDDGEEQSSCQKS